jgi:hypothetical protein
VNLLKSPLSYVAWFSFWLLTYLLIVPKLYPVYMDKTVWGYLPLVDINRNLGGPSSWVMPLSPIIFWLAARPQNLQPKWRLGVIVGLAALILLTGYFFALSGLRLYQFTLSPSPLVEVSNFGVGPLLILIGGVLLLGTEAAARRRDRRAVVSEEAAPAQAASPASKKAYTVGYWSAIIVTVLSLLPTVLALAGNFLRLPGRFDLDVYLLFNALNTGLSLLLPLSFVVLMASLHAITPPGKKVWTRIGLFFALVHAILYASHAFLYPLILRSYPQLYRGLIAAGHGFALSALIFAFVSLAGLSVLPVFHRGGIELAFRWCFVITGVFTVVAGFGYALSGDRLLTLPLLASLVAQLAFPVATALLAVVFRREEKLKSIERPSLAPS